MKARRVVIALLALSLLLLVAGCGDSNKTSQAPHAHDASDTEADTAEAPSGDVYRIGLQAPLSGMNFALGEGMLHGAELAAKEINDDGGVLGKKVAIVPIDDSGYSGVGVRAAGRAIKGGLDGVVGPYNSSVGLKTLPMFEKAGLTPIRLTSSNATDGMGFTLQPMVDQIAPVTTEAMTKWMKAKRVAIVFDPLEAYTKAISKEVKQELEKAGVKIVFNGSLPPGRPGSNIDPFVKKIAATNPDVIYVATYFPLAGRIAEAMHRMKIKAKCLADYGAYDPGFRDFAGVTAAHECAIVGVPGAEDFAGGDKYVDAFEEEFNDHPGAWSPFTYDSVNFLVDAAKEAGSFDAAKLKPILSGVTDWKGWTGTVKIDPKTGNRVNAPVVVTTVDADAHFHVDKDWAAAVGWKAE
jgi:branched-chain amino acid transport system substrate-binding protein